LVTDLDKVADFVAVAVAVAVAVLILPLVLVLVLVLVLLTLILVLARRDGEGLGDGDLGAELGEGLGSIVPAAHTKPAGHGPVQVGYTSNCVRP